MRKQIILAACLSAILHLGLLFGFNGSQSKTDETQIIEEVDLVHEEKEELIKPPAKVEGEEQDETEEALLPEELLAPGLNEITSTSVSLDALAQFVKPEAVRPPRPDAVVTVGIPSGSQHNSGAGAKKAIVFSVDQLDKIPEARFKVAPKYPYELRASNIDGVVELLLIVDSNGRVEDITVQRSTNVGFEKNAVDAVRKWRFDKGLRNGVPVSFKMHLPIHFSSPK